MSTIPPSKPLIEFRYPRSFLGLLLVGFAIVALPLIAGLVSNALSIEKLSEQSQKAVYNATIATQNARQLTNFTLSMERSARFFAVSGDRDLIETYKQSREGFLKMLAEFAALPLSTDMHDAARQVGAREAAIFQALGTRSPSSDFAKSLEREFVVLSQQTQNLNSLANQVIDQEVASLKSYAAKSRNQVFWQLLAMVPAALLLIAGFTYLLARPIRDLAEAIHKLGEGKLAKRISVSGPHDIEMLGAQLDWLRQRLIALEDQKTRFFQHVSHELKTPLTALREGSDLLSEEVAGKLTDEQREIARILKQNSLTLEKLIQDLLTFSQTQSADRLNRKTALDLKPLQLKDIIDEVIAAQKIALVAKSLSLVRECEKTSCLGDPEKLRVVVDNLLSNAIKYSPAGGKIVVRLGKHRDSAVIEVIDNGPGIPDEDRERVFDPFYRSKSALIAETKGSGLGLAIVRDYVEMHQGSVKALSTTATNGAHFRVVLPKSAST